MPQHQINSCYYLFSEVKTKSPLPLPQCVPVCYPGLLALTHQMLCESWKTHTHTKPPLFPAPSSSSGSFHRCDPPRNPSSFPSRQDLAEVLASVLFRTNKTYQNRVSKTDVLIGDGKQMRHAHSLLKSFNLQQK